MTQGNPVHPADIEQITFQNSASARRVILTDTTGGAYAVGGAGDGSIVDGVTPSIKATVQNYTNSFPLAVVLTNTTGGAYVVGGAGDGAIVDGANSSIKATVLDDVTSSVASTTNALIVQSKAFDIRSLTSTSDSITVAGGVGITNSGFNITNTPTVSAQQNTVPWIVGVTSGTNTIGAIGVTNSGFNVNNAPTVSAQQNGTWGVNATQSTTPWEVRITTGTNTIGTVVVSNTGFNVNNAPTVSAQQNGTWNVNATQSTNPWNVSITSGTNTIGAVGITNAGFTVTNAPTVSSQQNGVWNVTATQGTTPWIVGITSGTNTIGAIGVTNAGFTVTNAPTVSAQQNGAWAVTATQGTNPWNVGITSGTNTIGAIGVTNAGFTVTNAPTVSAQQNGTWNVNATQSTTPWIVSLTSGTNAYGKLSANSGVIIGDVNVVSEIPGTGATSIAKGEDNPHASGDTGVFILGVRNDGTSQTSFTNTTLDYNPIATDVAGNSLVVGNLPHDAVDAGAPIKIGGKTNTTETPTVVSNADRVDAHFDASGRQGVFVTGFGGKAIDVEEDDQGTTSTGFNTLGLIKRGTFTTMMNAQLFDNTNTGTEVDGGTTLTVKRGSYIEMEVNVDSAGVSTQIFQLILKWSNDGTNYAYEDSSFTQALLWEDTETVSPKLFCYVIPVRGQTFKVTGKSTNTTANNTFVVTVKARERINP